MTGPPSQRIETLTGIRGLAALWVAFHHARGSLTDGDAIPTFINIWLERGWLGVDLFFILSGFVIAHVHAADFGKAMWPEYRRFLLLRVARIYPAHLVMVLMWLPLVAVGAMGLAATAPEFWANYNVRTFLFALTMTNGWGLPDSEGWNLPSWSVGSEWFAYLTFPLWAVTVCRIRSVLPLLLIPVALIFLMYIRAFGAEGGQQYMPSGPWLLTRVISAFVIGCCLRGLFQRTRDHRAFDYILWGCLALGLALPQLKPGSIWDGIYVAIFAAIVLCAARATGALRSLLSSAPLVWLGNISYSLYLSHVLLIVVISRVFAEVGLRPTGLAISLLLLAMFTALALGVAQCLYRFVEDPSRRYLRDRWVTRRATPVCHAPTEPALSPARSSLPGP